MHSYQSWSRVFDVSGDGNLFMAWSQNATPGTDYVSFKVGTTESRIQNAMAGYTTDIQHHIVMAIDQGGGSGGQTRVTLYLDGVRTGEFDTPHTLASLNDARFFLGRGFFVVPTAHASYDEVRIHDRVYPATDVQASYRRGPVRTATPTTLSIVSPAGIGDTIRGINTTLQLNVAASDAQGRRFPVSGARWTSANTNASVDSTGRVQVLSSGTVDITAMVGSTSLRWTMPARHVRRLPLDPFLTTPAAGATWEIPVVIVAYIPTADARTIDVRKAPDFWDLLPFSLDTMEQRVLDYARRIKLAREQGSTFRGYKNPLALPSIGIRVTDVIVTYEHIPASTTRHPLTQGFFPDYHKIFADHGLVAYMQARGIKEVWDAWTGFDAGFPSYNPAIHDLKDIRAGSESNMASPLTGDISNSYRYPNDLPLLSYTWTMYGINIRRSQAEAVHNVGHQMEALLGYAARRQDGNPNLFWRDFVGLDASDKWAPGRAGATHFPPNATGDYDYHNTRVIQSDIEDWTPANAGQKTAISRSTWYNLVYPWPGVTSFGQREESQWYVYWFQNFPGRGNRIPRGSAWMTNWWAFMGDWDSSIRSGLGLYSGTPAANVGAGVVYPFAAARGAAPKPWVHGPPPRAPRK
ncbi:MAG: Ig-like domain-containing protein [Gemmatimonadetes bacterium]|nr:Ig-like domain-containing protein [Gemmatimonadota bacterium]